MSHKKCHECPDPLEITEDDGCLKPMNSSCITFDGDSNSCVGVLNGQTLNQVITALGDALCDLIQHPYTFSCSELASCNIQDLGNVTTTSPSAGDYLTYQGGQWVNAPFPTIPDEFVWACSYLNTCSIDDLSDVVSDSPASGDALIWNGTTYINTPIPSGSTVDNGLYENTPGNFRMGGSFVEDTIILGASFDFQVGTSISPLDQFRSSSNKLLFQSSVISIGDGADESAISKGLLFETGGTSLSFGTDVFNSFSGIPNGAFRIGDNITLSNGHSLAPAGTFIGTDIDINSCIGQFIGSDITAELAAGFFMGTDLSIVGLTPFGAGGTMFGQNIDYTSGGSGNQSVFLFGTNISVIHDTGIVQGNLVFNPTATQINSSATGNSANEKIRVDVNAKVWTTFNADGYYFFTDHADTDGWNVNTNAVIFTKHFVRLSQSNGAVTDEQEGCIRYNPSAGAGAGKFQGYVSTGWVDLH